MLQDHGSNLKELLKKMPEIDSANNACNIFNLLSDPTRLRILWILCHSEECVTNIAISINMSAQAVSFHLRFLKQSKLIESKKVGKETYYKLSNTAYANLVHKMIDDVFLIECPNKGL